MQNSLSRRRFVKQSALAGGSTILITTLAGCGEGGDDAAAAPATAAKGQAAETTTSAGLTEWRPLRIGAGGFVTGIDIANDGTRVVRTDTYGAYIWSAATSEWKPLLTTTSMPAGEWGHEIGAHSGVFEIAIAPSDSSRIYVAFNGFVFKSANKGVTFTKTSLAKVAMNPNDGFRGFGRKIAIDPANPDVVYFGTPKAGLFVTTDGGTIWSNRTEIPIAASDAGIIVSFDPASGTSGGRTKGVYVSSYGNGVFATRDAGATFAKTPGSPLSHRHMAVASDGTVWLTEHTATLNNTRKFSNGSWITLTNNGGTGGSQHIWSSIAIDPSDPKRVVLAKSGAIVSTSDAGATWSGAMWPNWPVGAGRKISADIPWLAWSSPTDMSNADIRFDPTQSNTLYQAEGTGVWYTQPPRTWAAHDWISQSRGIEQLVSNHITAPPGGAPLYFAWDRPVFKLDNPDQFPATHGPNRNHTIIMGWSGDYAIDDPKFVVGLINWWGRDESGFSTDGGTNWTKFARAPAEITAGKIGGSIAVSTRDNIVIVPNNNANPWVTRDRGASWQQISIAGVPTTGETGWGFAYYTNRHIVTADKVTAGTFYMYNYRGTAAGIYRSANGGVDWTRASIGELATGSGFNAKLAAVPGKAGHLFYTSGHQSGANPANTKFMRSTNGGSTWTEVANVLEVYSFGFGKAASGSAYPAIFIAGYVNRIWGLWRSDDNAANWVKIGDFPLGNFDLIKTVAGDMDRFGRCYVGFGGSGGAYAEFVGSFSSQPTTPTEPAPSEPSPLPSPGRKKKVRG